MLYLLFVLALVCDESKFIFVKLTMWLWCKINASHSLLAFTTCFTLYITLVKFYHDVITKSHLQLISTLIDTFFLFNETEKPVMDKRKLNGTVAEFLADS